MEQVPSAWLLKLVGKSSAVKSQLVLVLIDEKSLPKRYTHITRGLFVWSIKAMIKQQVPRPVRPQNRSLLLPVK